MTDLPIIFSGPMVREILSGRKTMTRRLAWRGKRKESVRASSAALLATPWQNLEPDDCLWVRESITRSGAYLQYLADHKVSRLTWPCEWKSPTRPSIHMPRWASRLTLEVDIAKVERLQDISEEDAKREGVETIDDFRRLWNLLHGPAAWDENPEVVAVSFEANLYNIDAMPGSQAQGMRVDVG